MENVNDYLSKIGFDTSSTISNVGILISNAINSGVDVTQATRNTLDEIKTLIEGMQTQADIAASGGTNGSTTASGNVKTGLQQPQHIETSLLSGLTRDLLFPVKKIKKFLMQKMNHYK